MLLYLLQEIVADEIVDALQLINNPLFTILAIVILVVIGAQTTAIIYLYKSREKLLKELREDYRSVIDALNEFRIVLKESVNNRSSVEMKNVVDNLVSAVNSLKEKVLELSWKTDAKNHKSE